MKFIRTHMVLPIALLCDSMVSRFSMRNRRYIARFGPFYVISERKAVLNGAACEQVFSQLEALFNHYPDISVMVFERCPGSTDDQELIRAGLLLHKKNIHAHVPSKGKICSGGVDLYFAATRRTLDTGAKLGVHAWDDDTGPDATSIPDDDPEHQMYINYYVAIGWSRIDAERLYRFIISSAPPNKTYYLTELDMVDYKILTAC